MRYTSIVAVLLALLACGSSTSPKRGPTIRFDQVTYDDRYSSSGGQMQQFQPSKIIVKRGSDPLPSAVTIYTDPSGGCSSTGGSANFISRVDQISPVDPNADSVVFTRSYAVCWPYAPGTFHLSASYEQNGKTVTAGATVTLVPQ